MRVHLDELLIVLRPSLGHDVVIGLARRTARQVGGHLHDRRIHRGAGGGNSGVAEEGEVRGQRRASHGDLRALVVCSLRGRTR